MRCIKCGEQAQVELRRHHSSYCGDHYLEFCERQVARNIKSDRMFPPDANVLVAVSGGKDSLGLWDLLIHMGYKTSGLYIDLGITQYSTRSKEKAVAFAETNKVPLVIKDVKEQYGDGEIGIPQLSKALKRVPCSGCGLTKRYVTNNVARELGFDVLATGHNLDDEAATLMGNVLHWQMDYLARQAPVLEGTEGGLVKKVKPLYTFTERETLSYVLLRGIDYIEEECPHAQGASSLLYKDALNRIELEAPGSKEAFLGGFLEHMKPLLKSSDQVTVGSCSRCGEPTTAELCAFCRMWDRAKAVRARNSGKSLPVAPIV